MFTLAVPPGGGGGRHGSTTGRRESVHLAEGSSPSRIKHSVRAAQERSAGRRHAALRRPGTAGVAILSRWPPRPCGAMVAGVGQRYTW